MTNVALDIREAASPELEKAIIGAILSFGEPAIEAVCGILKPEMFSSERYGKLYGELVAMSDNNEAIDLLSVTSRMKHDPELSKLFKPAELAGMLGLVGSGVSLTTHATYIMQQFICRKLSNTGIQIAMQAADPASDIADVLSFAEKELDSLHEVALSNAQAKHISRVLEHSMQEAETRQSRALQGITPGVPTGLTALDRITGGWQPGTLNIIAARPSMGKTAVMLHAAKTAASHALPGCIYSLEMSDISIANRLLLSECDIDVDAFRAGKLSTEEWSALERANRTLSKLPIYIDDNPTASMHYIKAHATAMHRKGMCAWVMIDYLQLAEISGRDRTRNREQEIAQATRQAKIIAKNLDIPLILLSQLNRSVESRADKKPSLADLRESGAIEQDADTVTFIWRPAYYDIRTVENELRQMVNDTRGYGQLIMRKNRDGAVGEMSFLHNQAMTRIYDYDAYLHNQLLTGLPTPQTKQENIHLADDYGIENPF